MPIVLDWHCGRFDLVFDLRLFIDVNTHMMFSFPHVDGTNVRRDGWFRSIPASFATLKGCALTCTRVSWQNMPKWHLALIRAAKC